jgi:hypothetical protein
MGGIGGGYLGARMQSRLPDTLIRRTIGILAIAIAAQFLKSRPELNTAIPKAPIGDWRPSGWAGSVRLQVQIPPLLVRFAGYQPGIPVGIRQ